MPSVGGPQQLGGPGPVARLARGLCGTVQCVQNTLTRVVAGYVLPHGTRSPSCYPSSSLLAPRQPTLSIPLSPLTSALFLVTTFLHVLYAPPTPICCQFLRSAQPLPPAISASLPPQSGTNSLLSFAPFPNHTLF